jgi:hypothetical protein
MNIWSDVNRKFWAKDLIDFIDDFPLNYCILKENAKNNVSGRSQ